MGTCYGWGKEGGGSTVLTYSSDVIHSSISQVSIPPHGREE